jgi:phage shock protein PspC (stress-responsive transcriptional regulator)
MNRRSLYRCRNDQRIAGVASGVAEFFDLDPTLVRIVWLLSILFGGFGLILYIAMAIIVPLEPEVAGEQEPQIEGNPHRHVDRSRDGGVGMTFLGVVLILFGALALADGLLPAWTDRGGFLWPAFILALGVLFMVTSVRRRQTDQ